MPTPSEALLYFLAAVILVTCIYIVSRFAAKDEIADQKKRGELR